MISRAVILHRGKILFFHRINNGSEYYILPGGHIEAGESEEEALLREIKEETGFKAEIDRKLWVLENPADKSKHHFFLITKISGKLRMGRDEIMKTTDKNKYILEWHSLKEVPSLRIFPEPVKNKMIEEFLK
jgi:8-oxo-dGTP pyrophosphatase MutT (NUDIX family)